MCASAVVPLTLLQASVITAIHKLENVGENWHGMRKRVTGMPHPTIMHATASAATLLSPRHRRCYCCQQLWYLADHSCGLKQGACHFSPHRLLLLWLLLLRMPQATPRLLLQ
jgi:hypothetical protein